jgi:hypothetical protein
VAAGLPAMTIAVDCDMFSRVSGAGSAEGGAALRYGALRRFPCQEVAILRRPNKKLGVLFQFALSVF